MNTSLSGKTALITGAGSGIGRAAVIKMAEAGANVILLDRSPEDSDKLVREIGEDRAFHVTADVSKADQMEKAILEGAERFGGIDIVFANAGQNGTFTPLEHLEPDDWNSVMMTNLTGTFLTLKYTIPYLKQQGGSIIITSSINGTRTFKNFGFSAYATTKAGQVGLGKMAAVELAQFKIRVNIVCPGAIDTNIDASTNKEEEKLKEITIPIEYPEGNQPLAGGSGQPEQVADLVHYLASDAASHVTGSVVYVDGVESLL
ncbi:SDR family NAD(P)-dependent oxidoreductase [Domibacillus sp. DTU_2020_1001157_1_SI_ALB_TIR_016]|uniref:SDR family oxidoreductase n=1 Tax=Domibacillus sp. DTU_2020_1001157_1_SI_ALB_TIR_016 TaxID=3077789 RepID=UPI0028E621F4|nr:SDR family NAD(P)-dependent oxidoreductase [Domibacillus sp. DTU_2020_1001157_1_SI_ALB_TIR_016]WNS80438.1 SDR family NAD(P)-dependent oxidoreductase [Domibacillus sp. DTU_2020_1001157_1_SI_ALB_TIR_016]